MTTNYENRLAKLEQDVRLMVAENFMLNDKLEELRDEIKAMRQPKKKTSLPYLENIPDTNTITQIRAELFKNVPKQGLPAYNLKLFVWTCPAGEIQKHHEGSCEPFYIHMNVAREIVPIRLDSELAHLATVVANKGNPDSDLIGCLQQKKMKHGKKGQRKYENEAGFIRADQMLALAIRGEVVELGFPAPLKDGRAENASQHVWYFTR